LTWRNQADPLQIYIREGTTAYVNSSVTATAAPAGGTFLWTAALSGIVDLSQNAAGDQITLKGISAGITDLRIDYTSPDGQIAHATVVVHVTYPIVLVHGFNSDASAWIPLASALQAKGLIQGDTYSAVTGGCLGTPFNRSDIDFCAFDYSTVPGEGAFSDPARVAIYLRQAIQNIRSATGASKVVILAHSMGGLVSRSYIQQLNGSDVDRLITIGTPHGGTVLADLISNPDVMLVPGDLITEKLRTTVRPDSSAVKAMAADGTFIATLRNLPLSSDIQYVSLIGLVDPSWLLVTKHAYEDLRDRACGPFPRPTACQVLRDYQPRVDALFASSDGLVALESQRIGVGCSPIIAQQVEHAPNLVFRFGPGGDGIIERRPNETELTDVFLGALGLGGNPICRP